MANDRKRKEAARNRMGEKRAASKDSEPETLVDDTHRDQRATCSTEKRRRLDSSADSSTSVRSNASTSSERVSKQRDNLTEEQKATIRAKCAERKRRSRANQAEEKKAADRANDAERMDRH